MTLAARPVGARSKDFIFNLGKLLTKAEITEVFPVPAYPLNTKVGLESASIDKKSSIFLKKTDWPEVGGKGKFLINKSEGFGKC